MQRATSQPTTWAHARALLITLLLCSQCLSAIPSVPLDARMLDRREGQRAIGWIAALLERVGRDPGHAQIERELITLSQDLVRLRAAALAPIDPLFSLTASRQLWFLFSSSSDITHRLRIEARSAEGAWILLYRANHEDRLGLAKLLAYRRLRGIYTPSARTGRRPQYAGFVTWLARRILRSHPEYDAVRLSLERLELATRARPNLDTGIAFADEREREQLQ
jgi:hypothetical protein